MTFIQKMSFFALFLYECARRVISVTILNKIKVQSFNFHSNIYAFINLQIKRVNRLIKTFFFVSILQENSKSECSVTLSTVWTVWSDYEKFGNGHVSILRQLRLRSCPLTRFFPPQANTGSRQSEIDMVQTSVSRFGHKKGS